ncbi:MAG: NAD(P)-dependent oxidoreductase, partial [Candidatus Margulisiibacteriota bacterium]
WSTQAIKQGVWEKLPGFTLSEATLGIVGVGNIGKAIARRAAGFGMKVIGNDIQEVAVDITLVSFAELLAEADIVTINCDLNPTSFHLIGEKEFAKMKSSAYIINTARGPIIDEKALVRALQSGQIAGAGLDVFEDEPLPQDSPLKKMDNCLFSAHNANSSPVAWSHVHQNTINNLLKGLSEGRKVKV